MKKAIAAMLAAAILLAASACGKNSGAKETQSETPGLTGITSESEKTISSELSETEEENAVKSENSIKVTVGGASFVVDLENNDSAQALKELLSNGAVTISASNYGGFEKVCRLPETLPSNDVQIKTKPGDVMLYSGNQIVFFYGSNTWAYTRLGKVRSLSANELENILGGEENEVTIDFE